MLNLRAVIVPSVLAMLGVLGSPVQATEPCDQWRPGPLTNFNQGIGDGRVNCMISWDHDGFPDSPAWLVVGGQFNSAGGVPAKNIAVWDGQAWRAFDTGITNATNNAQVRALAVFNGQLIAGGTFTQAGAATMTNNIARWTTSGWFPCGTGNPGPSYTAPIYAMAVFNNKLMVAGTNNGAPIGIAVRSWDGANWGSEGNGLDGDIRAMAVYNGQLYVAGSFTQIVGLPSARIARYTGSNWLPVPDLFGNRINTLAVNGSNNTLVAGGSFHQAGSSPANNVAAWNGFSWAAMGTGLGSTIPADDNEVLGVAATSTWPILAVSRTGSPGGFVHVASRWDGTTWVAINDEFNASLLTAFQFDPLPAIGGNELALVGGSFTATGAATVSRIGQLRGGTAVPLHHAGIVRAMLASGGVVVGGDFVYPLPAGGIAHYVARWNGTTVTPLESFPDPGEGTNGPVYALKAVTSGPVINQITSTYIGGYFSAAGNLPRNNIVRYTTSNLTALKQFNQMGQGFNNGVHAIESHGGSIYAAGAFSHSGSTFVNRVARWDGTNWQPVGNGLNGLVLALRSYNGELYAGGLFAFTGTGASAPYIAKWNGTSWVSRGIGTNSGVHALTVDTLTNTLLVGGTFTQANGVPCAGVARWNGTSFTAIGGGIPGGIVNALAFNPADNRLIAAGDFSPSDHLKEWNGTNWSTINGSVPDQRMHALAFFNNELQAGGEFRVIGSMPSPNWARQYRFNHPWVNLQPQGAQVCPGSTVNFTTALHPEYMPYYAYRWQKNGVNLNAGVQPGGSFITIATSTTLTITNTSNADLGTYTCVFETVNTVGSCPNGASAAAVLSAGPGCACVSDVSNDGIVNVQDLLAVIGAWGACVNPSNCPGDIAPVGGNDVVNVEDLLMVIGGWGICP